MTALIEVASKISTPLAFAGVGMVLFYYFITFFLKNADLSQLKQRLLGRIVILFGTYGFIISMTAIILGLAGWIFSSYVGPFILQNNIESHLLRNDHHFVAKHGSTYLAQYPSDDTTRHMVGTAYYRLGMIEEGINLYKKMLVVHADEVDVCSLRKREAIASLAAFHILASDPQGGLVYSHQIVSCKETTEGSKFNHKKLELMSEDEGFFQNPLDFKTSYFQSKYSLLKFIWNIQIEMPLSSVAIDHIREAYCEDKSIETLITNRFENGEIAVNFITTHNFEFEKRIIEEKLSDEHRVKILLEFKNSNCLKSS